MTQFARIAAFLIVLCATAAAAQPPRTEPNPMTGVLQRWWAIADYIVRAAEAMPEDKYAFKPFAGVSSFGEQVGHVADAHYFQCSRVRGEPNPVPSQIEGRVTAKAELVRQLKASVAYCDPVFDSATDASLSQPWQQGANRGVRLGPLVGNIAHDNEHSSTMIMLMRMSGIAPPPLDPRNQVPARAAVPP